MLKEKLLNWKYYQDKIPLYLQNSYGYSEHFKILFDLLTVYDNEGDKLLQAINITNTGEVGTFNCSEILDNFAILYGLNRQMIINNELLTFTDDELIKLILVKIIQINFDGTRKTFLDFYNKYFGNQLKFYLDKYLTYRINVISSFEENSNLDKVYKYTDLLFIDLIGIQFYRYTLNVDVENIAKFDDNTKKFDNSGARFI